MVRLVVSRRETGADGVRLVVSRRETGADGALSCQ